MKKLLLNAIVAVMFMSMTGICIAQETDASRLADHEMLRALKQEVTNAINNRNMQALVGCFTKNFVFTTIDQTTITSEDRLKQYYLKMFENPGAIISEIKTDPQADVLTQFVDKNTGYCYGSSSDTYKMKSGITVNMSSRWTATVVKQNGKWYIAAAHTGANFLENPLLVKSILFGRYLAGAGFLAGLILGSLVMWIIKRKKS